MKYEISIKDGYGNDMYLWRTFPYTQYVYDESVALHMSINITKKYSARLMESGISHTIKQVTENDVQS